jgi:glyoxylase-like metal-dependent hydrolase (beta-lactamase superfamily II)
MNSIRIVFGLLTLCLFTGNAAAALQKLLSLDPDGRSDIHVSTGTANVYVLRDGDQALLIDLGDAGVLDDLASIGVREVEWVLFTHHHREQLQGYPKLQGRRMKIAVPEAERAFFEAPNTFRKIRPSLSDRFAVHGASYLRPSIHPISVDRGFARMDDFTWRGHRIRCVETKGNSPGSMTYLLEHGDRFIAFSGDVMMDGARMHNWFDTEWDYGFGSGIYALVESAALLEQYDPEVLLPSHGPAVHNAREQLAEYGRKLRHLEKLYLRGYSVFRFSGADQDRTSKPTAVPHVWQISPHLFKFKGPGYAPNFNLILADDGHGLVVDCGLFNREFLDKAIERMREHLGLKVIDACIVTHMHGDHMLDAEHLRNKWGAQVWTLDRIADKCEHPERFDYAAPIQAYSAGLSAVRIDRRLRDGESLRWHGYDFTVDWMPGQTEFALALQGVIDGRKVVFTGDNIFADPRDPMQDGHEAVVARNSSVLEEGYIQGAEYLKRIAPDILVGGHSYVMDRPAELIERYRQWSYEIRDAFRALSAESDYRLWYDPFWVRAEPYRVSMAAGATAELTVHVRNFGDRPQKHRIEIHTTPGITADPAVLSGELSPDARGAFTVRLGAAASAPAGVRIVAFDITLDGRRYGEWFDAIVETR